jgi:hypothetical protein
MTKVWDIQDSGGASIEAMVTRVLGTNSLQRSLGKPQPRGNPVKRTTWNAPTTQCVAPKTPDLRGFYTHFLYANIHWSQ